MALFPPNGVYEDSSKYDQEHEDKGMHSETDGGYTYSRPRHSRRARRRFKTGFTDISEAQKAAIERFVEDHGTYLIFSYVIPDTQENINVRFKTLPKYDYQGMGGNHRYNVSGITIEEV